MVTTHYFSYTGEDKKQGIVYARSQEEAAKLSGAKECIMIELKKAKIPEEKLKAIRDESKARWKQ